MTKSTQPDLVAIYLHTLFNGGIESVMFNLIQGFLDRGIAVDLVLDILHYSPFEERIPPGTRVVKLESHKFLQRVPRLVSYLRDRRPDALLSATHFANEIACVANRLAGTGTRLIVSEHTNLSADIRDSSRLGPRRLLPWTMRLLYPLADSVVAVSNGVADDMCRVSGLARNRVQTIYNPIDGRRLAASAAQPLDHPWFVAGAPPVILGIGRMETQKNFGSLIRAFAQVRSRREAKLIILGEGSERQNLIALAEELGLGEDVSLPGFVMNPAVYMGHASVFAMSSLWEGFPVVLIEALTLGIPVVSTDCPNGPAEVLDNGKYGQLVPVNDKDALAAAIQRVLAGSVTSNAAEWVRQYDAAAITQAYLNIMALGTTASELQTETGVVA